MALARHQASEKAYLAVALIRDRLDVDFLSTHRGSTSEVNQKVNWAGNSAVGAFCLRRAANKTCCWSIVFWFAQADGSVGT